MLRHPRLAGRASGSAAALTAIASEWLIGPVCRRKKTLVIAGTALALAGAGSATASTTAGDPATPAQGSVNARLTADLRPAARPASQHERARHLAATSARPEAVPVTWKAVRAALNWQTNPAAARRGSLPFADQLLPMGTTGPQVWMPMSGPQLANATTIVKQTLARRMGIRSAVIAVATAMQESRLQDLGDGDGDSMGLFQQQPSDGWGTPQQIMNPAFAADAFLTALQHYQARNPGWAAQPLWVSAQSVQESGFPLAYAQWESQAATLVQQIAMSLQK
jgi:hypothetical protein